MQKSPGVGCEKRGWGKEGQGGREGEGAYTEIRGRIGSETGPRRKPRNDGGPCLRSKVRTPLPTSLPRHTVPSCSTAQTLKVPWTLSARSPDAINTSDSSP